MRAVVVSLFLALPAAAEAPLGLDGPAFRLPFETLLQRDDPPALIALHMAAQSGNTAALLSLPAALD